MEGGENKQVNDDRRNVLEHGERDRPQQHAVLGLQQLHAHLVLRESARNEKNVARIIEENICSVVEN